MPHAGGLTALDVKGDLLATAGMQIRMGQLSLDTLVQVKALPDSWVRGRSSRIQMMGE